MKKLMTVLLCALPLGACDLDLQNPNAPTEEEVVRDTDGLIALAVGMQGEFTSQFEEFVQASALVTDEWGTGTRSLTSYQYLFYQPQNLDADLGVVEEPFAAAYEVVDAANVLIANVPDVIEGEGLSSGIVALAKLFKGMALGMVALQYEQAPIDIEQANPTPRPRLEVLDSVIALLESARADIGAVTDAQLSGFYERVVPDEFDTRNTIDAMLARYYLVRARATGNAADYTAAATAAGRVDPAAVSQFAYTGVSPNPIYDLSVLLEYVFPLNSFVTDAEAGDERPAYWVDVTATPFGGNPGDTLLLPLAQYDEQTDPIFAYMPDEMLLIQAEAAAMTGDVPGAALLIDEVRTAGGEPLAGLPSLPATSVDTQDEVMAQIAYERRYELYMQGLRWEDTRSLDQYITTEPTIDWLPTPQQECDTNSNAGC